MFRGLGVCVLGNVLGESSYLLTLEAVREYLPAYVHTSQRDFMAGVSADAVALALCTPLSVICNRQMTAGFGLANENVYKNAVGTLRDVTSQRRGYLNLYAGVSVGLLMVPAGGMWWGIYGYSKATLYALGAPFLKDDRDEKRKGDGKGPLERIFDTRWLRSATDNPLINGVAGTLASAVTTTIYNPITVIRTRMQATNSDSASGRIRKLCRELVQREGPSAFFKGTSVNVSAAVLDGLVFALLYEMTKLGSDATI